MTHAEKRFAASNNAFALSVVVGTTGLSPDDEGDGHCNEEEGGDGDGDENFVSAGDRGWKFHCITGFRLGV